MQKFKKNTKNVLTFINIYGISFPLMRRTILTIPTGQYSGDGIVNEHIIYSSVTNISITQIFK